MLSWEFKSNLFMTFCKKIYFYKKQCLEKMYCLLYFVLDLCHKKVPEKVFTWNIIELLETMLEFIFNFFRWEFYHKNEVHGPHHSHSNIFHKRIIDLFKFRYFYVEPESALIFSHIHYYVLLIASELSDKENIN